MHAYNVGPFKLKKKNLPHISQRKRGTKVHQLVTSSARDFFLETSLVSKKCAS